MRVTSQDGSPEVPHRAIAGIWASASERASMGASVIATGLESSAPDLDFGGQRPLASRRTVAVLVECYRDRHTDYRFFFKANDLLSYCDIGSKYLGSNTPFIITNEEYKAYNLEHYKYISI
ncbi:hypothetical protein LLG39_12915 [bacterium]|nr:hypothetical protein [bacterium]